MLLAYWISASVNGRDSDSVIGRTKKEAVAKLEAYAEAKAAAKREEAEEANRAAEENGATPVPVPAPSKADKDGWKDDYEEPIKRVFVYADGHDLMVQLCSEGGGYGSGYTVAEFAKKFPELYAKQ